MLGIVLVGSRRRLARRTRSRLPGRSATLWLNALRMTIVPLVFALLVTGIASAPHAAAPGGWRRARSAVFASLLFAVRPSSASWSSSLPGAVADPGRGRRAPCAPARRRRPRSPAAAPLAQWLRRWSPANPIKAAAEGEMLPLVLFAILFGFAVTRIAAARARVLVDFFQAMVDAMLVIVHWVILVAPLGVFALAFVVGARAGVGRRGALGALRRAAGRGAGAADRCWCIRLVVGAGRRRRCARFARAVAPAQAVAASTQSSLASLPAMLESAQRLRVPPRGSAMVLPLAVSLFRITSRSANIGGGAVFARRCSASSRGLRNTWPARRWRWR